MKAVNLSNVQEAGDFTTLPAGVYICKVTSVEDVAEKEYLRVGYDIAEGEFAGYYGDMRANHPDWTWAGTYIKSYKEKALPMFKRFCSAISKSNGSFIFDGGAINSDEKTLIGKKFGIVLREEEYYNNSGEKKTRLTVYKEFPVDQASSQKVPELKKLKEDPELPAGFLNTAGGNDEIPFD